ncbi:MAG: tRNA adenosine(34) deaminase TadA [Anaerovoracaceae bacterium]
MKKYMYEALGEAQKAREIGEVPIGAVVVKDGAIIGRGHNLTESTKDPTMHAEMIAMRDALRNTDGFKLTGCELYVTLEPCAMCAGAIVLSRMSRVVIGTMDPKSGACGSVFNVVQETKLNHFAEIITGVMGEECSTILTEFFREIRKRKSEE